MIARTVVVEQTIDYVTADETDTAGDDTWFDHLGSRPITWLSYPRSFRHKIERVDELCQAMVLIDPYRLLYGG